MKIRLGVGLHERARALAEGLVEINGLSLEVSMSNDDGGLHQSMIKGKFDACEFSLALAVNMCGRDRPFIAIPVFPNRRFRHSFLYTNSASGIDKVQDLHGKRVASGSWANTASVWVRGALCHQFGLDQTQVKWTVQRELDEQTKLRASSKGFNISVSENSDPLVDQLLVQEIDALVVPSVIAPIRQKDSRARRMFPNFKEVEKEYYESTGILPISHVVVLRREVWENDKSVASRLIEAWEKSREISIEYTKHPGHSNLLWYGALKEEEEQIFKTDPWSYNFADNKHVLEEFMKYCVEQGIVSELRPVEEMFAN